jgi:hypothetical protein
MNDLAEVKPTDDTEIARKAADHRMFKYRHEFGQTPSDHKTYNRFLNRALRYVFMPLEELRDKKGPIAAYVVGAREARGEV